MLGLSHFVGCPQPLMVILTSVWVFIVKNSYFLKKCQLSSNFLTKEQTLTKGLPELGSTYSSNNFVQMITPNIPFCVRLYMYKVKILM